VRDGSLAAGVVVRRFVANEVGAGKGRWGHVKAGASLPFKTRLSKRLMHMRTTKVEGNTDGRQGSLQTTLNVISLPLTRTCPGNGPKPW
jgi:hypothetical protein